MTPEEKGILEKIVESLNNISTCRIYKFSQSDIQMKPKSGDSDWGLISIEEVMKDIKWNINSLYDHLVKARHAFLEYHELQISSHEHEIELLKVMAERSPDL